eukprot:6475442-Amphidinium_carterae.3
MRGEQAVSGAPAQEKHVLEQEAVGGLTVSGGAGWHAQSKHAYPGQLEATLLHHSRGKQGQHIVSKSVRRHSKECNMAWAKVD